MLSRFAEEHPPWTGMITSQHQGWFPINDLAAQHHQQPLLAGGGLPLLTSNDTGDGCLRGNGAFERSVCSPVIRPVSLTPSTFPSVLTLTVKPGKYKTELCRSWEEQGSCRYGV